MGARGDLAIDHIPQSGYLHYDKNSPDAHIYLANRGDLNLLIHYLTITMVSIIWEDYLIFLSKQSPPTPLPLF